MKKRKIKKIVFCVVIVIGLTLIYSFLEPFWVKIERIELIHSDIPNEFEGFSIVFLTDIHHGPYFSEKRLHRIIEKTNRLEPNLILLGGDYVHGDDTQYVFSCFQELVNLKADFGIYAVIGNHDYWMSEELTLQEMNRNDIHLLRNNGKWITKDGARFFLGGVDDRMAGNPDVQGTIQEVHEQDFTLVVSHNPDVAEDHSLDKVDWILSGHTHGGQVTLFGIWAPIVSSSYGQRYRSGRVQKENTTILVSNGIGTIAPPMRFFARPQIIFLQMQPDK